MAWVCLEYCNRDNRKSVEATTVPYIANRQNPEYIQSYKQKTLPLN